MPHTGIVLLDSYSVFATFQNNFYFYRNGRRLDEDGDDDDNLATSNLSLRDNIAKQAALLRVTYVNRAEGCRKYTVEDANKKLRDTELQWNYTSTSKSYSWV
jgi:hypothetical protein